MLYDNDIMMMMMQRWVGVAVSVCFAFRGNAKRGRAGKETK